MCFIKPFYDTFYNIAAFLHSQFFYKGIIRGVLFAREISKFTKFYV